MARGIGLGCDRSKGLDCGWVVANVNFIAHGMGRGCLDEFWTKKSIGKQKLK
jgi:hypothetical protein